MTLTITLTPENEARLHALAQARGQDPNHYATTRLTELLERDTAAEEKRQRGLAEGRELLYGPARPFDPDAIRKRYAEKYGMPDLSHLTDDELIQQAENTLAQMDPAVRAELEREGLV